MADDDKRTRVYAMRANERQNAILQRCMEQEDAPNGAWFVQACIAYAMTHLQPGALHKWVEDTSAAISSERPGESAPDSAGVRIWSRVGEEMPAGHAGASD